MPVSSQMYLTVFLLGHNNYCIKIFYKTCTMFLLSFSINLLAFDYECCSLIGYTTHYLCTFSLGYFFKINNNKAKTVFLLIITQ